MDKSEINGGKNSGVQVSQNLWNHERIAEDALNRQRIPFHRSCGNGIVSRVTGMARNRMVNARNLYVWVLVSDAESLYLMGSISHNIPEKIPRKHNGVDMHDDFSAYITLAKITKNPQG